MQKASLSLTIEARKVTNSLLLLSLTPHLLKSVSAPRNPYTTYSNSRESVLLDLPTVLGLLLLFGLALQRVVTPDIPVAPEVILLTQLVWYLWLRPALLLHLEPVPILVPLPQPPQEPLPVLWPELLWQQPAAPWEEPQEPPDILLLAPWQRQPLRPPRR